MSGHAGETSGTTDAASSRIDVVMDRASDSLVQTDYFETIRLCDQAIRLALAAKDWERLARICLPLQEARRQIRQLAVDTGMVRLVDTPTQLRAAPQPGCYLIQPPLIGADARGFRLAAERRGVPVVVLAREPMTRAGQWPIVGVSVLTVRVRLDPPAGVVREASSKTGDRMDRPIPLAWFEAAAEALGDGGIASIDPKAPAAHRAEDLIERLDAVPEHEKLHQRLADAARDAMSEPAPSFPRRRGADHPFSF